MSKKEISLIEVAVGCMCDMDEQATFWSALKHISEYCNENHVTWGMFTDIVEQIDHYMGHVCEIVEDENCDDCDEEDCDGCLEPENMVIQVIGM